MRGTSKRIAPSGAGRLVLAICALGSLVMLNDMAGAQSIERLIMPGPVIRGHAAIENACTNCHKPFQKVEQRDLCLTCHKDVAGDVAEKRGFHGRSPDVPGRDCKACHSEHKGRGADIVLLDAETFDHRQTDFILHGAHPAVPCASCHIPGRKHRTAPGQCVDCHRTDSPHDGQLGDRCADCHDDAAWTGARFDHDTLTRFALQGAHRKVACRSCHVDDRYKEAPTACAACHRLNDVHRGRFGSECKTCHSTTDWKAARFDHDSQTRFRLTGGHRKATCEACHAVPLAEQKARTACIDCHRKDDIHEGRNGAECAGCHGTGDWKKTSFSHDRDTGFPLHGRHAALACETCHRGNTHSQKPATACVACHARDDVHSKTLGERCGRCHNEDGWTARIRFDHDLTTFPLIGQHAVVPCEECHASQSFKGTQQRCIACHRSDDAHEGRLGGECAACHNPNGWPLWQFDHDTGTSFVLDGAHQGLQCAACHADRNARSLKISQVCGDCHRRDDPHRGSFGAACEQCHTTRSFRDLRFGR